MLHLPSPKTLIQGVPTTLSALLALLLLPGCGSLPSSGPSTPRILGEGATEKKDGFYQIFAVDQKVIDTLRKQESKSSTAGLASLASPAPAKPNDPMGGRGGGIDSMNSTASNTIAVGDQVAVVIFTSGGLFGATPSAGTEGSLETKIPPQIVDTEGDITIPFAGRIKAKGRSIYDVERDISAKLKEKTIDPWVIVTITQRAGGDLVTVTGDVGATSRVNVPVAGLRVLDALAEAGGSTAKAHETVVTVARGKARRSALLGEIHENPRQNIFLQPGDTVIVSTRKWSFTTLGAVGQRNVPFERSETSLVEALGGVGGILDRQGNPQGLFVFRFEKESTVQALGRSSGNLTDAGVPTVYNINLRVPNGMFMASQFHIRDKDIVYVGNAGTVGLMKALDLFNAITAPARSGLSTAAGFETLSAP